jgi:PAS domain S-box-containing protein
VNVMEPPPLPDDERRVAAVQALELLDQPVEERFDRITRLAAHALDVPIAFITLIDENRWWAVSCHGVEDREVPRAQSMCAWALGSDEPLIVPDLRLDTRFAHNPLVATENGLRFYAGKPIADAAGQRVGTLCVLDRRPRTLDADAVRRLEDLAVLAELEINTAGLSAALDARRAVERRLRAVIDAAREPIFITDAARRIEYFNPAAAALLGLSLDEAAGREEAELILPAEARLADLREAGSGIAEFVTGSGRTVTLEFHLAPIERGEGGTVVTFRDVTERQSEERARQRFIATASHELRTPVTAILGYAELMLDEDTDSEEQRRNAETIARNARRLADLVRDLLTTAELESDARPAARLRIDLADLVFESVRALGPLADARGVAVDHSAPRPAQTTGDPRDLDRAISNLMANAIKFSPQGETVSVTTRPLGEWAIVEVADHGPGIPAAEIPYVGRRFFRASTAEGVDGTGLGLAIAREIAERHGGRLEVQSELGSGSVFRLRLPAAR